MNKEKKITPLTDDPEYVANHSRYDCDPADYWEWAADRFGTEKAGWKAVLHCGGSVEYNRYIDFVHHRALRPFINNNNVQRVLDVGCGVGRWTTRFSAHSTHVVGIDRSQKMLHLAKQSALAKGLNPTFAQMNLTHLGLQNNYFDLVTCIVVLLHLKQNTEFRTAIREMIRITRPGGRVVILDEIPKDKSYNGQITRKRILDDYNEAVTAAGAKIERVRFVAVSPYRPVLHRIQKSGLPSCIKTLATLLSYIVLGAIDLSLTGWRRIPVRFWMQDKLVIIRKPPKPSH